MCLGEVHEMKVHKTCPGPDTYRCHFGVILHVSLLVNEVIRHAKIKNKRIMVRCNVDLWGNSKEENLSGVINAVKKVELKGLRYLHHRDKDDLISVGSLYSVQGD